MRARSMAALVFTVAVLPLGTASADPPARSYEVTITNLTDGQPLTPPVVATHRNAYDAFDVGAPASQGVQEIAENGDGGPLLAELAVSTHVSASLQTTTGPLVPAGTPGEGLGFGGAVTFTIEAAPGASRISFLSMLICTNDGFTGADGLKLPGQVGAQIAYELAAYDSGTEVNSEDLADMVPPCQGLIGVPDDEGAPGTGATDPALAEHGVIHHHQGITGGADLDPGIHGWDPSSPVASISIERTA